MCNNKSASVVLGVIVGVALVAGAVGLYVAKEREQPTTEDINEVFEQARKNVQKLSEAVEALKISAA